MPDLNSVVSLTEKSIDKMNGLAKWFCTPGEEAREYLIQLIRDSKNISEKEKLNLQFYSRRVLRECRNSQKIYEQAQKLFNGGGQKDEENQIDEDWLNFFFDKAAKVSNESMQIIWAKMLADEFDKPGSVSRKLLHIISIMDSQSARSFQTLSLYVFDRSGMISTNYDTRIVFLPAGFYENSFDFMRKAEKWLKEFGCEDYRDLALDLTMNTGELNSLENLGLIQQVQGNVCQIPLEYRIKEKNKKIIISPQDDSTFPIGKYTLTSEGEQLLDIIKGDGKEECLEIILQYLDITDVKYHADVYKTID